MERIDQTDKPLARPKEEKRNYLPTPGMGENIVQILQIINISRRYYE